jgi:hypothetical protein
VSRAQEDAIRNVIERWNAGEREIDPDFTDPDAEVHSAMTGATYRGFGGIKEWMAEIDEQFDSWQISLEEFEEIGEDRVLGVGSVHFRGRGSGVEFDQPLGWIFSFSGVRMTEMRIFGAPDAARAAAASSSS